MGSTFRHHLGRRAPPPPCARDRLKLRALSSFTALLTGGGGAARGERGFDNMAPAFSGRLQRGAALCIWTGLLLSRAAEGRHLAQTFSPSPFGSGACPPFTAADFSTSSSPCQVCMYAGSTLQVGTNPSAGCTNHVPGGVPQQHITYGALAAPALPAGTARGTPRRTRLASRCAAGRGLAAALAASSLRDRVPCPLLSRSRPHSFT